MNAIVRLVHVRFPLETYVKDILSLSTETNSNIVIEFVSKLYNNILTIGEWQSLQITRLGPPEALE